jgi:hypothetical protein
MSEPYRHQFLQASDDSETLTSVSSAYVTTNFRDDTNFRISLVIYSASGLTGNVQGSITIDGDTQWSNIQGGDLSEFATGIATQITCRYDEIRLNVTGGTCKARLMY